MNRIVIVTGGSDGIGKALAYAFAANNDKVIIIDRNTEPLKIISESMGSNVTWQQADVSQQPQVASTIKAITEKYKLLMFS